MSYIGNTVENQNYVPAIDYFNGDGSTVAFTLSRPVASVAAVQAVINNVPQNPGSAFTVSGSTITFTSAPPSGTANIYVYYTSPNTQIVQPGQGTVQPSSLSTGAPVWDANGSLGVGTSSPDSKLQVVNSVGASVRVGYSGGTTNYYDANTHTFRSANGSPSSFISNQYGIGLGTTTPSSGLGIAFPATQSASSDPNTLDDYEEGTWSPTVTASGGGSVGSYSSQVGMYVKIGGWVYFQMYVMFSKGTLSGDVRISNLPFTTKNVVSSYYTTPSGYWSGLATAIVNMVSYIDPNTTQFVIRKNTAASVNTNASLAATDLGGGVNEFMFSGMYPVN